LNALPENLDGYHTSPLQVQEGPLPALDPLERRVFFTLNQKAISVITGGIGSGKSKSLRYVSSKCHSSEYKIIAIVGGNYSVMDLYRQILLNFGTSYMSY